jgi:hypothetical protein
MSHVPLLFSVGRTFWIKCECGWRSIKRAQAYECYRDHEEHVKVTEEVRNENSSVV